MELPEAEDVLDEKGLVIRIAGLIEGVRPRGIEAVSRQVESVETIQRGIAMINSAAESKGAAFEDGLLAPILAETDVESPVIELVRLERRLEGRRAAEAFVAVVDILVGVPTFGLHEPAFGEGPLVAQHDRISIDPGMIERSGREIRIIVELLDGEAAGIAAAKLGTVEIQREQLIFVRAIADIKVGLPLVGTGCCPVRRRNGRKYHQAGTRLGRRPPG